MQIPQNGIHARQRKDADAKIITTIEKKRKPSFLAIDLAD